jgi:hypothetical protein
MSKDFDKFSDNNDEQIDLGLSELLNDLSNNNTLVENSSENIPVTHNPESAVETSETINEVIMSLLNSEMPTVLLVPQLIALLNNTSSFSNQEKYLLTKFALEKLFELVNKDEIELSKNVLDSIDFNLLSSIQINELANFFDNYFNRYSTAGLSKEQLSFQEFVIDKLNINKSNHFTLGFSDTVIDSKNPTETFIDSTSRKNQSSNFLKVSLIVLASLVSYYLYANLNFSSLEFSAEALSTFSLENEKLIKSNDIERREVSNLSAVMYDVSRETTPMPQNTPVVSPTAGNLVVPTALPDQSISKSKVAIDLTGPIEPQRVKDIIDNKENSIYERPVERLPYNEPVNRPSTSGSYDRNRDIDRPGRWDSNGQRYEVMINTSVMESPSFNAKEVEELYVGDRVLVESRIGRWLKIRSRDGKPGFIMAQDAQKLYD